MTSIQRLVAFLSEISLKPKSHGKIAAEEVLFKPFASIVTND
jgi:hypothetical protein